MGKLAKPLQTGGQQGRVLRLLEHPEVEGKYLLQDLGLVMPELLLVGRGLDFQ